MVFGFREHVRPAGETELAKVTVPVNPLTGDVIIVDEAIEPAFTVTREALAAIVKSWKLNTTVTKRDIFPLVLVTVAR